MNILLVGETHRGSRTPQRAQALRDLGHTVTEISTSPADRRSESRPVLDLHIWMTCAHTAPSVSPNPNWKSRPGEVQHRLGAGLLVRADETDRRPPTPAVTGRSRNGEMLMRAICVANEKNSAGAEGRHFFWVGVE